MLGHLPEELLINILVRLPAKTLLQIRCVSKSLLALISNPNFITTHATKPSNNHLLLVSCLQKKPEQKELYSLHFDDETLSEYRTKLEPPTLNPQSCFRVVGSCNGLVCLSDNVGKIFLWNPTISKLVTLPMPGSGRLGGSVIGYGFDGQTNNYKIVRFQSHTKAEVYSLKRGCWKSANAALCCQYRMYYRSFSAFVNGAIHWVGGSKVKFGGALIVLFDVHNEEFGEMKLPTSLVCERLIELSIRAYGESLSVFQFGPERFKESLWVMKEYGVVESWTKLFSFDLGKQFGRIIGLRRNNEVLLAKHLDMFSFDLNTQQVKKLRIHGIGGESKIHGTSASFYVDAYKESLVLLEEVGGVVQVHSQSCGEASTKGASTLLREKDAVGGINKTGTNEKSRFL